jgi:hypothetical protein
LISDLEAGDVLRPVEYELTRLSVTEYAHGNEELSEYFQSTNNYYGRQVRPPTMIHTERMRILEVNCTKEKRLSGEAAKDARIHYEYHAENLGAAFVGERLVISGKVLEVYTKRGRRVNRLELFVHTADGRPITHYLERMILRFRTDE